MLDSLRQPLEVGYVTVVRANGHVTYTARVQFAAVVLPALGCVALFVGTPFPRTERASMGVSMAEMFAEIPRHPMFALWWLCMLLTDSNSIREVLLFPAMKPLDS